jgi:hypothetical protein
VALTANEQVSEVLKRRTLAGRPFRRLLGFAAALGIADIGGIRTT